MMRNSHTHRAARAAGFRSGFEDEVAKFLTVIGIDFTYETEQILYNKPVAKSECGECGSKSVVQKCTYTPDFYLPVQDVYIETKGWFKAHDRAKHDLIKKQHPDIDLRMLFQSDGKATAKKRYSEWCDWKGIRYGFIIKETKKRKGVYFPTEWQEEFGV